MLDFTPVPSRPYQVESRYSTLNKRVGIPTVQGRPKTDLKVDPKNHPQDEKEVYSEGQIDEYERVPYRRPNVSFTGFPLFTSNGKGITESNF